MRQLYYNTAKAPACYGLPLEGQQTLNNAVFDESVCAACVFKRPCGLKRYHNSSDFKVEARKRVVLRLKRRLGIARN